MSLERARVVDAQVIEPGSAADDDGNPQFDWASPSSSNTWRGTLQQTLAVEVTDGRDSFISDWLLVLPPEASISGLAHVVIQATTYEVVGRPDPKTTWRGPHHVEVRLRLAEG